MPAAKALAAAMFAVAAVSCGGGGPQQAGDMGVAGVLDGYLTALGGRERLEALSTVHTLDSIHMAGLSGTVESWYTRSPFRGRTMVEVGPVRQEVLMLGDSVWSVDRNGRITAGAYQKK